MTAEELRIGNYHFYHIEDPMDEREAWDEVSRIDYDDLRVLTEFDDNPEYRPIPLTEEWLLKLGFNPLVNDYQIKGLIIHKRKRGFIVRKSIPQLDYVHQLQNLYFALTGKELTIQN